MFNLIVLSFVVSAESFWERIFDVDMCEIFPNRVSPMFAKVMINCESFLKHQLTVN